MLLLFTLFLLSVNRNTFLLALDRPSCWKPCYRTLETKPSCRDWRCVSPTTSTTLKYWTMWVNIMLLVDLKLWLLVVTGVVFNTKTSLKEVTTTNCVSAFAAGQHSQLWCHRGSQQYNSWGWLQRHQPPPVSPCTGTVSLSQSVCHKLTYFWFIPRLRVPFKQS